MKHSDRRERRISIRVKPNAKHKEVREIDPTHFTISVRAPAREGKANEAVLVAMADHLSIQKSRMEIVSGKSSRNKIIEIS